MRYAIVSKEMPTVRAGEVCGRYGARNVRPTKLNLTFCDFDDLAAERMKATPGLALRPVGKVRALGIAPPPFVPVGGVTFGTFSTGLQSALYQAKRSFLPTITGFGYTIVILDAGIYKGHQGLEDKIVYEANFSSSPTTGDILDHGTGVAWMAVGGADVEGAEQGLAPGAKIMNIKVLNDEGDGTEEEVVLGLEEVLRLAEEHPELRDPLHPDVVSMSLGSPDDGDEDNPVRVACRALIEKDISVVAAAGNAGPDPGTITCPATDPLVVAIGSMNPATWDISSFSSRGPTKEGVIKPDLVFFGENILVASARGKHSFITRSGTSFSAPAMTGGGALINEMGWRLLGLGMEYTQQRYVWEMLPAACVKPPGAPPGKDNTYGWGLPYGEALMGLADPGAILGAVLAEIMMPIVTMGMMTAMISSMTRSAK